MKPRFPRTPRTRGFIAFGRARRRGCRERRRPGRGPGPRRFVRGLEAFVDQAACLLVLGRPGFLEVEGGAHAGQYDPGVGRAPPARVAVAPRAPEAHVCEQPATP